MSIPTAGRLAVTLALLLPCVAATAATAPAGAKPSVPAAAGYTKDGVPTGLYFMTRYWFYTHSLEKAVWYFAPDGTVYQNLTNGFSPADLAAFTGNKGAAHVEGTAMKVTWTNKRVEGGQIKRDRHGFSWDMGIFTPVQPIRDAAEIAGTYQGSESFAVGGNGAAVSKQLELHPDGTFAWQGAAFATAADATSTLSAAASGGAGLTGTWRASPYSLTLTAAGGRVIRAIAFPYDFDDAEGHGQPKQLFFAGIMYKRK